METQNKKNYANILRHLNEGYQVDELLDIGIKREEVVDLANFLRERNLTLDNAMALNIYSNGSNMILGLKKGVTTKEDIEKNIQKELEDELTKRDISKQDIDYISDFVKNLNFNRPLYENYEISKSFLRENGYPSNIFASVNTWVKRMDSFERIDSIIESIDDALNKSELQENTMLFRGLKLPDEITQEIKNKGYIEDVGFTSTAETYEASFAKYDDYKVVLEMNCKAGTKGISIEPFSDYDSSEKEILLAPNDFDISKVSYANGKTVFTGEVNTKELEVNLEL